MAEVIEPRCTQETRKKEYLVDFVVSISLSIKISFAVCNKGFASLFIQEQPSYCDDSGDSLDLVGSVICD